MLVGDGMGTIEIAFQADVVIVGTRDNVLAAVWQGPPSVALLKRLKRGGVELGSRYPQGTLFVNIMLQPNPMKYGHGLSQLA